MSGRRPGHAPRARPPGARRSLRPPPAASSRAPGAGLRAAAREHVTTSGRLEGLRSIQEQAAAEDRTVAAARTRRLTRA